MAGHMTLFRYAMTRPGEMTMGGRGRAVHTRASTHMARFAAALVAVFLIV